MKKLSKSNEGILDFFKAKGYTKNGIVYKYDGKEYKSRVDSRGYLVVKLCREYPSIRVHRLVAYQKFGEAIFKKGVEVRHLDGNQKNNREDNIGIGTHSENMMDVPENIRKKNAINAASKQRKFTDKQVEKIRYDRFCGMSYPQLCKKWNASKSTIFEVLNRNYVTKK